MNEIEEAQRALVEEFSYFDNWMDRYQYIIDLGRRLPEFPDSDKTDARKIKGCQSQVWFVATRDGERLNFRAVSDAAIVSGLIALLLRVYSGRKPEDILETSANFVAELGLDQHLSPTRSNGLTAMLNAIRSFAREALQAA